jgi:hypothetical protein
LLGFLLQSHAFDEVVDPGIDGLGRVQIKGLSVGLSSARNDDKKGGKAKKHGPIAAFHR